VLQHVLHACNELRVMQTVAQLELRSRVTNHLGLLLYRQEKLGESEQMYQRALASHEKTHGTETLTVQLLGIVNNLGNFHRKQGRLDEGEGIYIPQLTISPTPPEMPSHHLQQPVYLLRATRLGKTRRRGSTCRERNTRPKGKTPKTERYSPTNVEATDQLAQKSTRRADEPTRRDGETPPTKTERHCKNAIARTPSTPSSSTQATQESTKPAAQHFEWDKCVSSGPQELLYIASPHSSSRQALAPTPRIKQRAQRASECFLLLR
jgi:hypothetical protein